MKFSNFLMTSQDNNGKHSVYLRCDHYFFRQFSANSFASPFWFTQLFYTSAFSIFLLFFFFLKIHFTCDSYILARISYKLVEHHHQPHSGRYGNNIGGQIVVLGPIMGSEGFAQINGVHGPLSRRPSVPWSTCPSVTLCCYVVHHQVTQWKLLICQLMDTSVKVGLIQTTHIVKNW